MAATAFDIAVSVGGRIPTGPTGRALAGVWAGMLRDPLAVYARMRREHGDALRIPFTRHRAFYLLSRPEYAEHVLVAHQDRYVKAFTYRPLKAFLGDGLLTSEGEVWQRHRRLVQPVFGHRHVQGFAPAMVAAARTRAATWHDGETVELAAQMRTLTMDVVGRVLFGTDLADDAGPVGESVTRMQGAVVVASLLPSRISPERTRALATRLIPGLGAAAGTLEGLVARIITERLETPHAQPSDLLDLLVASGDDPLTSAEIRDEVMTLVLAGHETTASALTWTLTLLSQFPAARERLHAELDAVLCGRDPVADDVDKLVWTRAVINEAMRLYPPAWTIERDAVVDDDVAGVAVPAGNTVAVSPYLLHRHPEFWPNPEGFDPERFMPEQSASRPRYAYVPFGGGRRICVGSGFAQLEATVVLAALAQQFTLDLVPGARVQPRAGVTIHPRHALPVALSARR